MQIVFMAIRIRRMPYDDTFDNSCESRRSERVTIDFEEYELSALPCESLKGNISTRQ